MGFKKSFPKKTEDSRFPEWVDVELSESEESMVEEFARKQNLLLMKESLIDAKELFAQLQLKDYQTDVVRVAVALFEKKASHVIYHKEEAAQKKFNDLPL